jgi:hypothetical protein
MTITLNKQGAFSSQSVDNCNLYLQEGLTKREYFAGLAMQATDLEAYAREYGIKWAHKVAQDSVLMADALLAELDKQIDNE